MWHVSSRSGVATLRTLVTYLLTYYIRRGLLLQLYSMARVSVGHSQSVSQLIFTVD